MYNILLRRNSTATEQFDNLAALMEHLKHEYSTGYLRTTPYGMVGSVKVVAVLDEKDDIVALVSHRRDLVAEVQYLSVDEQQKLMEALQKVFGG